MRAARSEITARTRALRRDATVAERTVWKHLSCFRPRFRRQHPLDPYVIDFACRAAWLAIEIDGDSHGARQDYDRRRTSFLGAGGWRVLRFTNQEVLDNLDGVLETILQAVQDRSGLQPTPVPSRKRGRGEEIVLL